MSWVKILTIGDLHFSDRSAFILRKLVKRIHAVIDDYKPDKIVFLGDNLDRFGGDPSHCAKALCDFLASVTKKVSCVVLIGNHDIENKNYFMSDVHHLCWAKHYWENIIIVDNKCVEFKVNGLTFQAVPYCPVGRLQEGLDTLPNRDMNPSAIFCHQEIVRCVYGYSESKSGDYWPPDAPLLVCGHIHMPQQFSCDDSERGKGNVYMPGSPYQDNFGEPIIPRKTISMMTFYQDGNWSVEKINLNLPLRIKKTMMYSEYIKWVPLKNNIYWITVTGSYSELAGIKYAEKATNIRYKGGKVECISSYEPQIIDNLVVKSGSNKSNLEAIIKSLICDNKELMEIHSGFFK